MCTPVIAQSPNDYCRANNIPIDRCSPTSQNSGFNVSRSQYEDSYHGSNYDRYDHNNPNRYSLEYQNRINRNHQSNIHMGVRINNLDLKINSNR